MKNLHKNNKDLISKYTEYIFTFNVENEGYDLYCLDKKQVFQDFGFHVYCDFLYNFFSGLFFLVEFNETNEIYFIMKTDLKEINFLYTSDSYKIYNIINDDCKKHDLSPISIV